jgi:hypothetical protein
MNQAGIKSIKALDEKLQLGADAFAAYEQKHPPFTKQGGGLQSGKFKDVGVVRITLRLIDKAFLEALSAKHPHSADTMRKSAEEFKEFHKPK